MFTGAVGAGIGAATGGALRLLGATQFGYQIIARTVMGGIAGGVVSEIYGGNFWEGFAQGGATAATAFLFNECRHFVLSRGIWYEGYASYYESSGRPTASGEVYDEWGMTGAMHGVKFGTIVTVEYLDPNGKVINSLKIRTNDHGPSETESGRLVPHSSRIIDLSPAAFDKLTGNIYLGVVRVRVYVP